MKKKKSKGKLIQIKMTKKGKPVTFKLPANLKEWATFFRNMQPIFRSFKFLLSALVILAVINLRDVFTSIDFSQEVSGTIVWVFVLFGLIAWGFR